MNKSVLIIEDDERSCEVLCAMLKRRGIHAECAVTFGEALAVCHAGNFDLAITDLVLPDSPDPVATVARTHELGLPVIILTGAEDPAIIRECQRRQLQFILKPIVTEEVIEKVLVELEWRDPHPEIEDAIIENASNKKKVATATVDGWWQRKAGRIGAIIGGVTFALLIFTNLRGGFEWIWRSAQARALTDQTIQQGFTDVNSRIGREETARAAETKETKETLAKIGADMETVKTQNQRSITEREALFREVQQVKTTTDKILEHLLTNPTATK